MTPTDLRVRVMTLAAVVIGLALPGTQAAASQQDTQPAPPYRYVVGDTVALAELEALAPLADKDIQVRKANVVTSAGKTVADLKIADTAVGPVLVEWRPRVMRPFLKTLPPAQAVMALAPVLARHVPVDTTLLAWWDVSREFRMLTGLEVAFDKHLGIPLFLPVEWHDTRKHVREIESRFWQTSADARDRDRFMRFVYALLAEPRQGVAELRQLVQGGPAVLILHVRDIILLGQLAPDKIGLAYRDITATGDVHGMVKSTHRWLEANDYTAYTVMRLNDTNHQARVIALMDETSANTLAARLLPFVGNGQSDVPGVKLVYTAGGFWVYELGPKQTQVTSRKDTTAEEE